MGKVPIVFDLGNVLLTLRFDRFLERTATKSRRSVSEIRERYVQGERKRLFETGKMSEEDFIGEMASWLGWPGSQRQALESIWTDVFDDMPGAEECVEELASTRPLWIMSDTNVMHWRHVRRKWPFLGRFDRFFTSYSAGMLKTDPAAFKRVIESISGAPGEVLYFDDVEAYITNARSVGLDAHLFESWSSVMEKVRG